MNSLQSSNSSSQLLEKPNNEWNSYCHILKYYR
jgi:hypothetical protein